MGACASIPKAMRGDAGAAPPPELPKEETTNAAASATEVAEEKAANNEVTVEEEEKKTESGDEKEEAEEKEGDKDGKRQSLGFLLNQSEEAKEEEELPKTEYTFGTESAPSAKVNSEDEESEALPVSDENDAYVATVARATNDEKETEAKEEKLMLS